MGGSLNTAHKKSKKKKAAAPAFESGTLLLAAAALPVFLEMAPSSGQQITEADRSFRHVRRNSKGTDAAPCRDFDVE